MQIRQYGERISEYQHNLPADQIDDSGTRAFVRDMHDLRARHQLEQFAREMSAAANGSAKIDLSRLLLRERQQLSDRFHRKAGIHREQISLSSDLRDRNEVFAGVVRKAF